MTICNSSYDPAIAGPCGARTALLRQVLLAAAIIGLAALGASALPALLASPNTHLTPEALAAVQEMMQAGNAGR
jgi:hypothetical protein